jgi:hypothetical protein
VCPSSATKSYNQHPQGQANAAKCSSFIGSQLAFASQPRCFCPGRSQSFAACLEVRNHRSASGEAIAEASLTAILRCVSARLQDQCISRDTAFHARLSNVLRQRWEVDPLRDLHRERSESHLPSSSASKRPCWGSDAKGLRSRCKKVAEMSGLFDMSPRPAYVRFS